MSPFLGGLWGRIRALFGGGYGAGSGPFLGGGVMGPDPDSQGQVVGLEQSPSGGIPLLGVGVGLHPLWGCGLRLWAGPDKQGAWLVP